MQILTLNTSGQQPQIDKILFSRPVGPLHSRRIGIFWPDLAVNYLQLHSYVQTILTLRHHPVLFTQEAIPETTAIESVLLQSTTKSLVYDNTDNAIEQLESSTVNIFTSSETISSKAQIFFEKYLLSSSSPINFFGYKTIGNLYSATAQPALADNCFLFGEAHDFAQLGDTDGLGEGTLINVRLQTMLDIALDTKNHLVVFYADQILFVSHEQPDKAVVINYTDALPLQSRAVYIAILASLIADTATYSPIDLAYTAGYLMRKAIESKDVFANLRSATEAF